MSTFTEPEYPEVLKPENWSRKKGVIAKIAGETGIGASLTRLKQTYDAIDWKIIKVDERKPKINDFRLPQWEQMCKEAATLGVAELGKLRKAAYETRDLAQGVGKKFGSNPLIPKDSTRLCLDIATAADHLGVACNPNSISGYIAEAYKAGRQWLDLTVKLVEDGTLKKNADIVRASLSQLKRPSDWKDGNIKTKTRNVTQILGNAVKAAAAGYPLKISAAACKKLFDDLALYADRAEQPFENDDGAGLEQHRKALDELMDRIAKL